MRSDILASAILCGIEDVVKEAKNKFDEWMYENKRIPPNLREVIYLAGNINIVNIDFSLEIVLKRVLFIGIRHGEVKEWNFCWDKYNQSRIASERKLLLKVLGASNDPWLLQR